jgi:DNA ligase (NAD+)
VIVRRAGDVIPEVVAVVPERRVAGAPVFAMPAQCPVCGSAAVREEGEADHRCTGGCSAAPSASTRSCISRSAGAMDIEGLGEKLVDQMVEAT